MSKKPKATVVNMGLLTTIANAPNGISRIAKDDYDKLSDDTKNLVVVDPENIEDGRAAISLSEAGKQYMQNATTNPTESENKGKPMYGIMKGIPVPESKRGNRKGAGAPTQYNFEAMEIGDSFFVPNSDKPDAAKKLGSTVSQQNMKYSEPTGQTKEVERAKRGKGNKAELDSEGKKIMEKATVEIRKQTRKYVLRAVKKDQKLGEWVVPEDGALISRVPLDAA